MNRQTQTTIIALLTLLWIAPNIFAHPGHAVVTQDMIEATDAFLASLSPEQRQQATFEFSATERIDWHFIPKERTGVMLKEMSLEQRRAAHHLIQSALSNKGYFKAISVMFLEEILRQMEKGRPGNEQRRDQEKYWFAVFGTPTADQPWGWRVEGHHLSLNFTSVHGLVVSTPMFFGANPGEIRSGPRAGLRVLGVEESLARKLVKSLRAKQLQRTVIAVEAPSDVITAPGNEIDLGAPAGLPTTTMDSAQNELLDTLIDEYITNLRPELSQSELQTIHGGRNKIHFAWAGGFDVGEGHYYRIHGPTFVIEYDNTQNDANHIHTVWHSLTDDFALDTLRKHHALEAEEDKKK